MEIELHKRNKKVALDKVFHGRFYNYKIPPLLYYFVTNIQMSILYSKSENKTRNHAFTKGHK